MILPKTRLAASMGMGLCLLLAFTVRAEAPATSPTSGSPSTAGSPSTVIARQGSAIVTLEDMDTFAERIPEDKRAGFFNSPQRIQDTIMSILLQKQLAAEARAAGLEHDPEVEHEVAMATDEALAKIRMRHFRDEIKVPNLSALAKEEYLGHKEKYVVPELIEVKQVLVSADSRSEEAARKIAEDVEQKAMEHPDQFDALVDQYSDDPYKKSSHGIVTDAGNSKSTPEFGEAARALKKPGEISPVFKTRLGYHVLKLERRTTPRQKTFAEVQDEILARLRDEYIQKTVRGHTDALRNKQLDANPDLVASLRTRYGSVAVPVDAAGEAAGAKNSGH
jgi:peptidyl-prolyl cis-trans isomerase C